MPLITNLTTTPQLYGPTTFQPGCKTFFSHADIERTQLLKTGDFRQEASLIEAKQDTNIVIFSGCPYSTTGGGQQPPQIANALVELGYNVNFVQCWGEPNPCDEINIIGEPHLFAPREKIKAGFQTDAIIKDLYIEGIKNLLVLTFTTDFMKEAVESAISQGFTVVYWCLDDWDEINKAQRCTFHRESNEVFICKNAHHVIATADNLKDKIERIANVAATVIENGINLDQFYKSKPVNPPKDMLIGEEGTATYWGELGGRWIDYDLIETVAKLNPQIAFNLIGPAHHAEKVIELPNVAYLGPKKITKLYRYGLYSDYGLIPFKANALTHAVNPIKAYEYIACGLPIVTPDLKELHKFPNLLVYDNAEDLSEKLRNKEWEPSHYKTICEFLDESTWKKRALSLLKVVGYDL